MTYTVTYLHTPARDALGRHHLIIGVRKQHARQALSLARQDSVVLYVWRDQYGTHAEHSCNGLCRMVHGRREAIEAVRAFIEKLVIPGGNDAVEGWFRRGARGELALVLTPIPEA